MRKIDRATVTEDYTDALRRAEELHAQHIAEFFQDPSRKPATRDHYKRFRNLLLKTHHRKCAYCESRIENQPGDVEHYRPKGRVTDENGEVVRVRIDAEEIPHPGYFWLAYDVNNLLMSCLDCNRLRGHDVEGLEELVPYGKADCFPIGGRRAVRPGDPIDEERPLLVNPVLDDPLMHFSLEDTGNLISRTTRGHVTIEILGLNRENLRTNRRNAIFESQELWIRLFEAQNHGNEILIREYERRIYEIATERGTYTLACWYGLMNGLERFGDRLQPDIIDRILDSHEARVQAEMNRD